MHFWIDKRSQTCGFSGRHRVPSSLSARGGGSRRWVGGVKPMVTPVHRFHQVDCVAPQCPAAQHPRRPRPSPPPYNVAGCSESVGRGQVEVDSSVFLELPQAEGPPPATKLRCGMWASFALATVFVGGAKLYVNHQGSGLEVVDWSVVVAGTGLVLLLYAMAWCSLALCRRKTEYQPPPAPLPLIDIPLQPPPPEAPPPPYHIAIDLPHSVTPPPSYDKAVS